LLEVILSNLREVGKTGMSIPVKNIFFRSCRPGKGGLNLEIRKKKNNSCRRAAGLRIDHFPRHAAVEDDVLAGDEAVGGIGQEKNHAGDVVGLAHAAAGMLGVVGLRQFCRFPL
jgi:hypothetical protein